MATSLEPPKNGDKSIIYDQIPTM